MTESEIAQNTRTFSRIFLAVRFLRGMLRPSQINQLVKAAEIAPEWLLRGALISALQIDADYVPLIHLSSLEEREAA